MYLVTCRRACAGLASACLASMCAPAAAMDLQLQVGRSYMDSYAANAAFVESVLNEKPIGSGRFTWAPDISLGWINGRDLARFRESRYGTDQDSWLAAGGVRFRYGDAGSWSHALFFSFQGALHAGRTEALSSVGEFVSTAGWQGRRLSFQIRHVSNGGLHDPNRGETMLLVGTGFDI